MSESAGKTVFPDCAPKDASRESSFLEMPHDTSIPLNVLVIEDCREDAALLLMRLRREGYEPTSERIQTAAEMRTALASHAWDIVFCDSSMPEFDALSALRLLHEAKMDLPFIVVSGTIEEEKALAATKLGATDYLLKDQLGRLGTSVRQALERARLRRELDRTEAALRASDARVQVFSEYSPAMIFVKDAAGRYTHINPVFEKMFGLTQGQVVGRTDKEIFPAEQAAAFQVNDRQVIDTGTPMQFEERARCIDGIHISVVSKFPLRDAEGRVTGLCGIATDITERKRTEEALRTAQETVQTIFDSAPVAILGLDLQGRITKWNAGATRMFGWAEAEVLGEVCPTVPADGLTDFFAMIDRVTRQGPQTGMIYPRRKKNGERIQASLSSAPLRNPAGDSVGVMVILEDITEGVRTQEALARSEREQRQLAQQLALEQEALRESEERFRSIFEHAGIGIALVGPADGRLLRCNQALAEMLGYDVAELERLTVQDVSEPRDYDADRRQWGRMLAGEIPRFQMEKRYLRKDGQLTWGSLTSTLVRDAAGRPLFVIGMVKAIDERKRADADLRAAERQLHALVGRLNTVREEESKRIARELHDDLGQRLTAINMELANLEMNTPEANPGQRNQIAQLQATVDRTIEVVQKISSELRLGQLDLLGLTAAVDWQVKEFSRLSGIRCRVTRLDEVERLTDDQCINLFRILQEALTNILRHASATEIEISLEAAPDRVTLTVRDNGRGITPSELMDRNAIGLLGMRERAELLGGAVTISGAIGQGTTVRVSIPRTWGSPTSV